MSNQKEIHMKDVTADPLKAVLKADNPAQMPYFEALEFLFEHGQGGAAKSSGERICAGIILSLYNGYDFKFALEDLGKLSGNWREAANAVITGWKGETNLYYYLREKFGEKAWNDFRDENDYRIAE